MIAIAILLVATCFAGLVFSAVEGVKPAEVIVWIVFVLGTLGVMYACPDLGVWP